MHMDAWLDVEGKQYEAFKRKKAKAAKRTSLS
jgi:hypothetical protein